MHGAGTRKRVESGEKKDPRTAGMVHGGRAQMATKELYAKLHPDFAERIKFYREDIPRLIDEKELVYDSIAWFRAVMDIVGERRPGVEITEAGTFPPAIARVLSNMMDALKKKAEIDGKMAPITINISGQVNSVLDVVAEVLEKYVPRDKFAAAASDLSERLRAMGQLVGSQGAGSCSP